MIRDDEVVRATMVTQLASKLHLVVPEAALFAAERGKDDLFEHRDFSVHEAGFSILVALDAERLDDVTRHTLVQLDEDIGKFLVGG